VSPSSCITRSVTIIAWTPMRLAMKFGVSLAGTIPLPSRAVAKPSTKERTSGAVSAVGMTSSSFM
jgi:hypothetical protein